MSYGLTDEGYIAPRAADLLPLVRSKITAGLAALGVGAPDYARDIVYGVLSTVMADVLDTLSEGTQALYDAFDVGNATGVPLRNLCLAVGVPPLEPTYSTATVTIAATTGTVILAGRLVQGGGDDGKARWRVTETVTAAAGAATATVQCTVTGPVVATAGQISTIVTPVSGWTSVTNAAAATPGRDRETNDALRRRRQQSLQTGGNGSLNALRGALLALDGIQAAVCIDNDRDTTQVVQGVSIYAHGCAVIVYPDTLTTAQASAVASTIYGHIKAIRPVGAVVASVTGGDGFTKEIRFGYATGRSVAVAAVLALRTGYVLADVKATVESIIADYFLALGVGDEVSILEILTLIGAVDGIKGCVLTLDAGSVDIVPDLTELCTLDGTASVS